MTGIIYCYTSPSNKKYVGQTYEESRRRSRWKNLKYKYGGGLKLENARKKYGPENFTYTVLETVFAETKKELVKLLDDREIFWISELDTYKNGYNSTIGGRDTYSEKRSESHFDKKHTDETKQYLSEINKQRWKDSPWSLNKLQEGCIKYWSTNILQYDLNGDFIKEWNSAEEAAKELNIDSSSIRKCCRGEKKHAYHFVWKNKTENYSKKIETGLSEDERIKLQRKQRKSTPVLRFNLDGTFLDEFESCRAAAKLFPSLKDAENSISKCCRGVNKTCGGFKWKYKYDN